MGRSLDVEAGGQSSDESTRWASPAPVVSTVTGTPGTSRTSSPARATRHPDIPVRITTPPRRRPASNFKAASAGSVVVISLLPFVATPPSRLGDVRRQQHHQEGCDRAARGRSRQWYPARAGEAARGWHADSARAAARSRRSRARLSTGSRPDQAVGQSAQPRHQPPSRRYVRRLRPPARHRNRCPVARLHSRKKQRNASAANARQARSPKGPCPSAPAYPTSRPCLAAAAIRLKPPPTSSAAREANTSPPRAGRRHLGDNVDDHVAEADQSGDHGPARSANSFSATRSRSKLLVSSTVRTASEASCPCHDRHRRSLRPSQRSCRCRRRARRLSGRPATGRRDAARARQRRLVQIPVSPGWFQSAQRCLVRSGHDHQRRPAQSPMRSGGRLPRQQPIRPAADPTRLLGCRAS